MGDLSTRSIKLLLLLLVINRQTLYKHEKEKTTKGPSQQTTTQTESHQGEFSLVTPVRCFYFFDIYLNYIYTLPLQHSKKAHMSSAAQVSTQLRKNKIV